MWFAITSVFLHFLLSLAYLVDDAQQNTLERVLEDNKIVLAAFTSNDLDSLTPFRNVFKHAAEDSQIPFLHIDCAQERNLCEEQDVHTYPAIRLYKKNNSEDATNVEMRRYRGPKTVNA